MASIRVSTRSRKISTRLNKQTLSVKKTKYEGRSSINVKNTPTVKKSASIEQITGRTRKRSTHPSEMLNSGRDRKSQNAIQKSAKDSKKGDENPVSGNYIRKSLRLQSNKISNFDDNPVTSAEKLSKGERKLSVATYRQTRNSTTVIEVVRNKSVIHSEGTYDHSKTPVSTKCVLRNRRRKTLEVSPNGLAWPLKNISNNNKQASCRNTKSLSSFNMDNFSPCLNEKSMRKNIRCTRSSVSKLISTPLKKPYTNENILGDSNSRNQRCVVSLLDISKVQISTKLAKKLSVKEKTEFSAVAKEKSVTNSSKYLTAKRGKSDKNHNSSTRSVNQISVSNDRVLRPRPASLSKNFFKNQESVLDRNTPLVTPVKKKSVKIIRNSTSKVQKKAFTSNKTPALCQTQTSIKKNQRLSLSPLKKVIDSSKTNIQATVSPRCSRTPSISQGKKNSKTKLNYGKKSVALCKYAKAKSFHLTNIPIDDLITTSSYGKRKVVSANGKKPGKNTLKRKRMSLQAVILADEGYQDDIFESQNFDVFKELKISSPVSEEVPTISTPKFGFSLTPIVRKKTPVFKDCFNLEELAKRRKVAEEYFFRRKNYGKNNSQNNIPAPEIPEKKKLEFNEVIAKASKIQEEIDKRALKENEEEGDDHYFSFIDSPLR